MAAVPASASPSAAAGAAALVAEDPPSDLQASMVPRPAALEAGQLAPAAAAAACGGGCGRGSETLGAGAPAGGGWPQPWPPLPGRGCCWLGCGWAGACSRRSGSVWSLSLLAHVLFLCSCSGSSKIIRGVRPNASPLHGCLEGSLKHRPGCIGTPCSSHRRCEQYLRTSSREEVGPAAGSRGRSRVIGRPPAPPRRSPS